MYKHIRNVHLSPIKGQTGSTGCDTGEKTKSPYLSFLNEKQFCITASLSWGTVQGWSAVWQCRYHPQLIIMCPPKHLWKWWSSPLPLHSVPYLHCLFKQIWKCSIHWEPSQHVEHFLLNLKGLKEEGAMSKGLKGGSRKLGMKGTPSLFATPCNAPLSTTISVMSQMVQLRTGGIGKVFFPSFAFTAEVSSVWFTKYWMKSPHWHTGHLFSSSHLPRDSRKNIKY